jgi:hypothetical protein
VTRLLREEYGAGEQAVAAMPVWYDAEVAIFLGSFH